MWLEAFLPPLSLSSKTLLVCGGDASFLLLTAYIVQLVGKHGKVIVGAANFDVLVVLEVKSHELSWIHQTFQD